MRGEREGERDKEKEKCFVFYQKRESYYKELLVKCNNMTRYSSYIKYQKQ